MKAVKIQMRTKVIIVALVIPVFIIGVLSWDKAAERDLGIAPDRGESTPSCLSSLLTTNPQQLIGDFVYLNDVHIRSGPRPDIFILSGRQGRQMLLLLQDARIETHNTPITADVEGRIRRLPLPLVLRKQWKLTKAQLHSLGQQQIYISAKSIMPSKANAWLGRTKAGLFALLLLTPFPRKQ